MKNLREIKARLAEIKEEMAGIIESSSNKKRELTSDEQESLDTLQSEKEELLELAAELVEAIEDIDESERASEESEDENASENKKRKRVDVNKMKNIRMKQNADEKEKVSLVGMIQKSYRKQAFNDAETELIKRGQKELIQSGVGNFGDIVIPSKRATLQATVAGQGAEDVATDLMDIITPVWANQVLQSAGATFLTGSVGNIQYPLMSKHNADWATETGAASDGAPNFKSLTLSPKRLTSYVDVSKQMLIQDNSGNLESIINTEIVKAVSNRLENTLLGEGAATATQPAGLFNIFPPGVLTPIWDEIVNLEAALESDDLLGSKKVIMNPAIKGALKSTRKDAGSGLFLMNDDNSLNGYSCLSTSNSFGLIMGDFSRYVVANWGGTDITVNPYSRAINGIVRIVINTYWDAASLYDTSLTGQPKPFVTANI